MDLPSIRRLYMFGNVASMTSEPEIRMSKIMETCFKAPEKTHLLVCCCHACSLVEFDKLWSEIMSPPFADQGHFVRMSERTINFAQGGRLIVAIVQNHFDLTKLMGIELRSWQTCKSPHVRWPLDMYSILESRMR